MDLELRDKVVLITGSSHGLGRAIAEAFASEGSRIIINGRNKNPDHLRQISLEIKDKYSVPVYICPANATNKKEVVDFFKSRVMIEDIGKLDILVNNVGNIEKFGLLPDLEEEDWFRAFDITFMSMVRFSLAAYPWLKKSGHGRIINIGSIPSHQPGKANPHYAAAKGALLPVSKMMANDFAKDNILVNVVCPSTLHGGGWNENVRRKAKKDKLSTEEAENEMLKEESAKSPLGRLGTLKEVADQVVFLASNRTGFTTGQCINIDGGITRSIL